MRRPPAASVVTPRPRTWLSGVAVALLVLAVGAPAAGVPARVPPASVPALTPLAAYPLKDVPAAVENAAADMMKLAEQHPDQFTGASLTRDGTLAVALPGGADVDARETTARQAIARHSLDGAGTVAYHRVRYSLADLLSTKERLLKALDSGGPSAGVTGVGLDLSLGAVVVYVQPAGSEQTRVALKARYGDAIIFRAGGALQLQELDRARDTAAHFGGAGYRMYNSDYVRHSSLWCSTAFPVDLSGARYMLTAGHCLTSGSGYRNLWATGVTPPTDARYYFGTTHTTTITGTPSAPANGTQDRYGDWALMRGSTYSPTVYNCGNPTGLCSSLTVGAAHWTTPAQGTGVCVSGRTTAQTCRYRITDPGYDDWTAFGLRRYAHVARTVHDGDLNGVPDCDGTRAGDSGGAVYQSITDRPGFVRALGIHTGSGADNSGRCYYVFTKLSGVRAWAPTVTMPTF